MNIPDYRVDFALGDLDRTIWRLHQANTSGDRVLAHIIELDVRAAESVLHVLGLRDADFGPHHPASQIKSIAWRGAA